MTLAEILDKLPALTFEERKILMNHIAASFVEQPHKRSLLELEGLGAEIWEGIDAQEYVDQMRDEWDKQS